MQHPLPASVYIDKTRVCVRARVRVRACPFAFRLLCIRILSSICVLSWIPLPIHLHPSVLIRIRPLCVCSSVHLFICSDGRMEGCRHIG